MVSLNTCCILWDSRKPKISLHKIHTCFLSLFKNFRFLFSNTSPPPGFAGALIIVDNSALWLFLFTNNCSTFEEKISQKGSFWSNGLTQTAVCCWYSHRRAPRLQRKLARAQGIGYHSVARMVHERVKSKAPMLQTDAMYSVYLLTVYVLWCQPIKLIQVASNSELHENHWNNFFFLWNCSLSLVRGLRITNINSHLNIQKR